MSQPFSFGSLGQPSGGSSANTPASNPFGSATSGSTTTQPGSLFGLTTTASPAANPFGNLGAAAGAGASKPSLFGNTGSNSGSGPSTPSLFGASTGNAGGGSSLFGGAKNASNATPAGGLFSGSGTTAQSSGVFGGTSGGFSFGQKKDEGQGTSTPTTSSFGTPNKENSSAPSGLFGGSNAPAGQSLFAPASSAAPAGSTTPAATKPSAFSFGNSTTPAGPPPADPKAPGPSLFASAQPSSGGLFGGVKPQEAASNPPSTQPGGLFGGSSGGAASLFSGLNKPASSDAGPVSSTTATAPKPTFSLPSGTSSSSQPASTAAAAPSPFGAAGSSATAPALGGLFSGAAGSKAPTTTTAPAAMPSLFGNPASNTSGPGTSTTAAAASAAPSLFSGLGKPATSTIGSASTAPSTAPATSTPSLFGGLGAATTSGVANGASTSSSAPPAPTNTTTAGPGGLGASTNAPSTAGPAPQLSRLKNKTMDEIIMRWASDLSLYQKEFQDQAAKVASWDRLLVENGDKIQKLYTSTFEAERASAEVERQLANVENQQDELAAWLTRYESEVDKMFDERVGDSLHQGPDQERERTYKLAEKLTDRLDEMGKDLTNMIQEINTASASLSKTNKPDDPLSQIVRVLNGHLSQLQWIDQNAAALQAKVAAAQKAGQSIGTTGQAAGEGDAADDFYRSYMSRR